MLLIGQHTKRRDYVLPEVLVLVVAEDDHEVGVEGIYLLPNPAEPGHQAFPVPLGRGVPLVVPELQPHVLGPVHGVFELLWETFIVFQRPVDGKRQVFVGGDQRRVVGYPCSEYLRHFLTS